MAIVPLISWNVQLFNRNELNLETLYNDKQETSANTYEYSYDYPTVFSSLNATSEHFISENDGSSDRYERSWTVTNAGFYRIRVFADESVDHWIYVNGREFLNNSGGQRNTANLYMYLNKDDVVRVVMNNDNDFDQWSITFIRAVSVFDYTYKGTTVHTPYIKGNISA